MKDNILILGGGFIGQRLHQELKAPLSKQRISDYTHIEKLIKKHKPKILINCIGHTGRRNVDDCEKRLNHTLFANTYLPILIAEAAMRHNLKFVHVSSGCIYHYNYKKQKPITEDQTPDYYDLYYSRTKIYADAALQQMAKRYPLLITRIRIPLDNRPHPRNILNKLINYKTVIDVPNSVTYIPDFARALKYLIKTNAKGIFNIVCKEPLRYPKLLAVYQKHAPQFRYKVIPLKKLKLSRTNLILSTRKLQKTGFPLRKTSEVMEECVKSFIKY